MAKRKVELLIFRGTSREEGRFEKYEVDWEEGMVVLDAVLKVQAKYAPDLAVRWNCKAAKCGSCAAEINGKPALMCKTRVDSLPEGPIRVEPLKTFPLIKDLVTNTKWNHEVRKKIGGFKPRQDASWRMMQEEVDRAQEFRRCIECFLCQDTCHVLREHKLFDKFIGPAYLAYCAYLEMHPMDGEDRIPKLKEEWGIGYCNITKCCTEVCPEEIHITDNAIIPLKERVADRYYDPLKVLFRKVFGKR